jgi:hypothetical protein
MFRSTAGGREAGDESLSRVIRVTSSGAGVGEA